MFGALWVEAAGGVGSSGVGGVGTSGVSATASFDSGRTGSVRAVGVSECKVSSSRQVQHRQYHRKLEPYLAVFHHWNH